MHLMKKWNELMGPKDERLEAEENKTTKVSAYILLAGSLLCLYYSISLEQVASVTEHPLLTPLGESVLPMRWLLLLTILTAGVASIAMQVRSGHFSSYTRLAAVERIPWGFVAGVALACGGVLGVLTCGMRILAEIQIVGVEGVAWLGDIAIGIVFFEMGFVLAFAFTALTIRSAIQRRQELDRDLEA